jgi:hypothetical protein
MNYDRRRVLRGMLQGGAITVALPLFDCLLNDNGTAFASGAPMPVRFGTYFWALGINKQAFTPKTYGAGFELTDELAPFKNVRDKINVITNFNAFRDTTPNLCHYTGWVISRTGSAPPSRTSLPGETIDVTVANQIGKTTRFKSLTATATGDVRTTFSYENANTPNPPEVSPLAFYTRLFGPDFQDPNASSFTPPPRAMVRKSALSSVLDDIKALNKELGAEDRMRLDQYLTGVRHLEQQFDQQLTKPEPIAACLRPAALKEEPRPGNDAEVTTARNKLMSDLMVMAIACDQTRVFNMSYAQAFANTTKPGYDKPHHTTTHEEPVDEKLGYQPVAHWFTHNAFQNVAYFVEAFAKIKEGDGTLLDNVLLVIDSDHSNARIHSLEGMAAFTAGGAGGRMKSGLHIDARGTAVTRLGYTAMRVMGLDIPSWGTNSNNTSKEFSEILV